MKEERQGMMIRRSKETRRKDKEGRKGLKIWLDTLLKEGRVNGGE